MSGQRPGLTVIVGGVDRSAEFRCEEPAGRRITVALLTVIVVLLVATGWLVNLVFGPQLSAATPVGDSAPRYAYLKPAELNTPRSH